MFQMRYQQISTVTTASMLLGLFATSFSGDLMKAVIDFERRVTAWEHDSKDALSNLLKIGVVIKALEKGGFRAHLLISTAGTRLPIFFWKVIDKVELAFRNLQVCAGGLVDHGQ